MRKILLGLMVCGCLMACSSTTTIYLVRHAEKEAPNANGSMQSGSDVNLSEAGKQRAEDLSVLLKKKKLKAVFATPLKRTRQTVSPTAIKKNLSVTSYAATQPAANKLMDSLLQIKSKSFLVAGHSNTVPAMVRYLKLPCSFDGNIPENDYDNLFIIRIKKGKKSVEEKTYGVNSPAE